MILSLSVDGFLNLIKGKPKEKSSCYELYSITQSSVSLHVFVILCVLQVLPHLSCLFTCIVSTSIRSRFFRVYASTKQKYSQYRSDWVEFTP